MVPPGLRKTVPTSGMTEDLIALQSEQPHPAVRLCFLPCSGPNGPRHWSSKVLKVEHKTELSRPRPGRLPKAVAERGRGEALYKTNDSLFLFSPSSDLPLFL